MNLTTTDAQGLYTKMLIGTYRDRPKPTDFLKTFFPDAPPAATLAVSIEVQRGTEKIAVDVVRGSDGNRNDFGITTEKMFVPPYFREYFDITSLNLYDRLWGAAAGAAVLDALFAQIINEGAEKMLLLREKIERTYENYRAQVLQTGIVTFVNGAGQINFNRKATSMVDLTGAGGYWTTGATDVFAQLQAGCVWLRKNGKTQSNEFVAILGDDAIAALYKNTTFLNRQNLFHMQLDTVAIPRKESRGGVYHGTLTAGPYRVEIWSYGEYYEDAAGVMQPILNPKNGILLPAKTDFKMAYAAVPQLINPGQAPQIGQYVYSDYIDEKRRTHEYHIESAGVPIPLGVDQIYTFKAVA